MVTRKRYVEPLANRRDGLRALPWMALALCAAFCVLAAPIKATFIMDRNPAEGTLSTLKTGAGAWGVWSFVAGIAVLALVTIAYLLVSMGRQGWAAAPLTVASTVLILLADFSTDYRRSLIERAREHSWEVVSLGPSGAVATVATLGALLAIGFAVCLAYESVRRWSTRPRRSA